jgi:RimJ/RimL family protein N-acetyltransferase
MPSGLPVGPPVPAGPGVSVPVDTLTGTRVSLRRPEPAADAAALYPATHGSAALEAVWTYMGYGPWPDEESMREWIDIVAASRDAKWYTVTGRAGEPIGMAAFLNHSPADRRIEVGHIWYAPTAQRTTANSEAFLLMGAHAFGTLGCRRLEWKCDALNARSRHVAARLGFTFEGVFRRHMIVKGRNRDTAWYSIIDEEWPVVEAALRSWLYAEPRDERGRPHRPLARVRDGLAQP